MSIAATGPAEADHRRDFEPLGDDRRVAARAAELGGESLHELAVEVGRLARRQVVGQHDHRLRNRRQRLAALAEEVAQQALLDVVDVVGALRDVVVEVLKDLRIPAQRAADGIFRPEVLVADGAGELRLQAIVVEHRQMGVEDGGILLAQLGPDRVAVALDLVGRLGDGVLEPLELGIDGAALDEPARDPETLAVEDERLANRDAG